MAFPLAPLFLFLWWTIGLLSTSNASVLEKFKFLHKIHFNCTRQEKNGHLLHGFPIDPTIMVDTEHNILMDWTPKAACTKAVVMFLDHMGFVYQRDFVGWPHNLRFKHYVFCGYAIAQNFRDPNWVRFKIVRNPFDRAASSYFHTMSHADSRPMLPDVDNMTFSDFITFLEGNHEAMLDKSKGYHFTHQYKGYERHAFMHKMPSYYHVIIRSEEADEGVARLNALLRSRGAYTGLPFNYSAHYVDVRDSNIKHEINEFIGDKPWREVRRMHPTNYKYMYDDHLRLRVQKLFEWDLKLYNYTWPYDQ